MLRGSYYNTHDTELAVVNETAHQHGSDTGGTDSNVGVNNHSVLH